MKKQIALFLALVLAMSLAACGGEPESKNKIPDVFGVYYTDAIGILEADGFEVSAIETSVGGFSDKLLYPLEQVEKGTVFKINEYIIDNNGNLNKDYDVFYDGGLVCDDTSIIIYYAKEDYVLVKDEPAAEAEPSEQPSEEPSDETEPSEQPSAEPSDEETVPAATEEQKDNNSIRPEFKAAMDSYEAFFDEYVTFMNAYMDTDDPLSMMGEYTAIMQQYAETMDKLESIDEEELSNAEALYYAEVMLRINQKLLEIG